MAGTVAQSVLLPPLGAELSGQNKNQTQMPNNCQASCLKHSLHVHQLKVFMGTSPSAIYAHIHFDVGIFVHFPNTFWQQSRCGFVQSRS